MPQRIELSIIIVEYKSGVYLEKLLMSLPKRKDWELIVIDNTNDNVGYGAGCNIGAQQAQGKHLLFLNPDVLIDEKSIERMVLHLKTHPGVGVVGPKFINADNEVEQSSTEVPSFTSAAVGFSFLNTLFPKNSISRKFWKSGWNRKSTETVGVVSGAALMVRATEFKVVGQFDPTFFLYWEEYDLCTRMLEHHRSTVFLSTAVAHHPREVSMKQAGVDTTEIFQQSRRKYFSKHLGFMKMAVLEIWFILAEQWRLLSLLFASLFFRLDMLDRIGNIGDLGRDYLQALSMVQLEQFSLLGIPSSIPRFSQGPFNVWFDALSFMLGGRSVFAPPILAAVLTTVGVGLLYVLLEKRVGKQIAWISSVLVAISPAAIMQSRMPFYLFAEPLFLVIFLWRLLKVDRNSLWTVWWAVLSFWLLFQWELATLPLILLLPFVFWHKNVRWIASLGISFVATVVGLAPQILHDIMHQCAQLCGLVLWSGYRVVAVSGFDGKHGYSFDKVLAVAEQYWLQLSRLLSVHWFPAAAICLVIVLGIVRMRHVKKSPDALLLYTLVGSGLLTAGILIHSVPSEAYFPPFLVFIPILLAYAMAQLRSTSRWIITFLILTTVFINGRAMIHNAYYSSSVFDSIDAARWIVKSSEGNAVTLKSFDEVAMFPTYLDGIRFLVLTNGGALAEDGQPYYVSLTGDSSFPMTTSIVEFSSLRVGKGVQ